MVDTRTGKSTSPYTAEEEAKAAAILKERREKKEAKKKALIEEQAAKLRKIEEEMAREKERLKKEEEDKLKAVDEEDEQEVPLERRRREQRGESSGTQADQLEKKISEWVANLSLREDEEAIMYVPREEQEAAMKKWEAEEDPLKRQIIEDDKRMEWKFRLTRERKARMEAVSQAAKELEEVKKQREQIAAKEDLLGKMEIMARNIERLTSGEERESGRGRDREVGMGDGNREGKGRDQVRRSGWEMGWDDVGGRKSRKEREKEEVGMRSGWEGSWDRGGGRRNLGMEEGQDGSWDRGGGRRNLGIGQGQGRKGRGGEVGTGRSGWETGTEEGEVGIRSGSGRDQVGRSGWETEGKGEGRGREEVGMGCQSG
ncbi:hypothetical protein CBR_g32521 [Chara braunii]|uniref:Uncharacterized protein n=1 Tax=Chara braunii TaxID=69332 RepID=A0A388LH25_CHABU|nr:hypothetical protein CBR_g32521 [Chara braunii]|eukprot:GBG81533.1 hypothetical protein CBR_g32521 [Chara braunii]